MKSFYKRLIVTLFISVGLGVGSTAIVVSSQNGYMAGFAFIPLLLLMGLASLILIIVGLITLGVKGEYGPWLLLSAALIPGSFIFSAITAKQLELGAYQEERMTPIVPRIANKIIFKKDATLDEVQKLWSEVLSDRVGVSGEKTRPGIQGISSNPPENDHEIVTFSFFATATEAEKADVRARIMVYPPVDQYLENVDTSPVETPTPPGSGNSKPFKTTREPNTLKHSQ